MGMVVSSVYRVLPIARLESSEKPGNLIPENERSYTSGDSLFGHNPIGPGFLWEHFYYINPACVCLALDSTPIAFTYFCFGKLIGSFVGLTRKSAVCTNY